MTAAPFAMIVVALAGLFVFGGFFALIAVMVARSDARAAAPGPENGVPETPAD